MMVKSGSGKILIYFLLTLGVLIAVYPFFFMIMNSLKTGMEIKHYPNALPRRLSLRGYRAVFSELNMLRLYLNTVFVAASTTLLNCLFNAMVAFALEKLRFPWRELLFKIILATMMIPGVLLVIPTYMFMYRIGWVDSYRVLILRAAVSAYHIFLIKQFYKHIDNAYLEAAKMDGAHYWRIFTSIMVPMSLPALATVGILVFMDSWNDLFHPLLYIREEAKYTLQLGLFKFRNLIPDQNLEQIWAALSVSTLPIVLIYLFFQRQFVRSFSGISLK